MGSRAPVDTEQVNSSGTAIDARDDQTPLARFDDFSADYIRRLIEHDVAIESHFVTYFGDLLAIKLRRYVRSSDIANEVRQETFFRVLKALRAGELKQPERLGAFVNSVCRNVLCERFREKSRCLQLEENSEQLADNRIDLDAPLVNEERRRLVASTLADFSDRDRQLFHMILLDGVDKADACKQLGVSEEYYRVLRHRALLRFREKLETGAPCTPRLLKLWSSVKRVRYPIHHRERYSDGA